MVPLLLDQQSRLTDDGDSAYIESAVRIGASQALPAAALNLTWDPALEALTLHRYAIVRDGKTIDLLGDGSKLTVFRRETNLERATLDGQLTATLQPDDVRVGDIVDVAFTRLRVDPALRGRSQTVLGLAPTIPYGRARVRVLWPAAKKITWRAAPGLLNPRESRSGADRELLFDQSSVTPAAPPRGAPQRFLFTNMVTATDMGNWPEVSRLMAQLYEDAAAVPASGPLRDEVKRIAALSVDPKVRALAALAVVQQQVRYLLLAMDGGGYTPAAATLTWTRRYGDCKGKTVLLIALLRELGIKARPALVSMGANDGLETRPPMAAAFDHVLVEATIGGRTYWLDGTRPGDRTLEQIRTPEFKWALPVTPAGSDLVALKPDPLSGPDVVRTLDLDASGGLDVPAKATGEQRFTGDAALSLRLGFGQLAPAQRDQTMREYWRSSYDFVTPDTVALVDDAATGSVRLTMSGTAKLAWNASNGRRWYSLDGSRVGQNLDIVREPGPNADAPFAVEYPSWREERQTLRLPEGGRGFVLDGGDVETAVGPFRIKRTVKKDGATITMVATTQTNAAEIAFKDAPVVKVAMAKLYERDVNAGAPSTLSESIPTTAEEFVLRASQRLDRRDFKAALADADAAVALSPKSARAHGARSIVLAWLNDPRSEAAAAKSVALDPQELAAWHARALAGDKAGRLVDAEAAATRSLEISPDDGFAYEMRALTRLKAGNHVGALADAEAFVKTKPGDAGASMLRVRVLSATAPASGLAAYAAHLKTYGGDSNMTRALPLMFVTAGQLADARTAADMLVAADPANDEALYTRARVRLRAGDRPGGVADFGTLIERSPSVRYFIERAQLWESKDRARWSADLDAAAKLAVEKPTVAKTRAVMEMRSGNFDAAAAALAEAAKLEPADPQLAVLRRDLATRRSPPTPTTSAQFTARASKRLDDNEFAGALSDADAAIRLTPKSALAHGLRAVALAWLGDAGFEAAAARAVALDPKEAIPWHARAIAAERAGKPDAAEAAHTAALAVWPTDPFALGSRAALRKTRGDWAGALADIDARLKLTPNDSRANLLRLQIVSRGDPTALLDAHTAYLKERPFDLSARRLYPAALASAGRTADASRAMDSFIAAYPDDAEALYQRARLRMRAGDRPGALADFDAVLKRAPDTARLVERAQLRDPTDRAGWQGDLERAGKLGLDAGTLWTVRAEMETRAGDYQAAEAALIKAEAAVPGDQQLRGLRLEILRHQGRTRELLALLEADTGTDAEALNGRCWARATANMQLDRALAECDAALRLKPDDPAYLDSRALVHFRAGRYAAALSDYDAVLKRSPSQAASLFGRGLTRTAMGADGSEDLAAARRFDTLIDDVFVRMGIRTPPARQ